MRRKKLMLVFSIFLMLALSGYWFFTKTIRGSSLVLYAVGGWKAPVKIRYACAKETDARVKEKFTLPLQFDEESKDLLKNFWHYSYYRECLHYSGYDFKGIAVPKSSIAKNGATATYANPYAEIKFNIPTDSRLLFDNRLDVNVDDRLLTSKIETGTEIINVHSYTSHKDFTSFGDIESKLEKIFTTKGGIIDKRTFETRGGVKGLRLRQDNGIAGIGLVTPGKHLVFIFGNESLEPVFDEIEESLGFVPKGR